MSYLNAYADEAEELSEDNYFVRHWKGHLSLPVSYWVNGGILFMVTGAAANILLMVASDAAGSLQTVSLLAAVAILLLVVLRVWSFVGIWRSAGRHVARGGSSFWAVVARVMVVLGVLSGALQANNTYLQLQEFSQIAVGRDPLGQIATFRLADSGKELRLDGVLAEGSADAFADSLAAAPAVEKVVLTSSGGRIFEAEKIGTLVKERGLSTHVEKECNSACTLILLAGKKRTAAVDAAVGFHRLSFPGMVGADDNEANATLARHYAAAGLPSSFTRRVSATSPEDLWVPTAAELVGAKVLTGADAQIERMLGQAVEHWTPRLPQRVDDMTTLTKVSAKDGALVYDYRVNAPAAAIEKASFVRAMGRSLQAENCADAGTRELFDLGGRLQYSYRSTDGREIANIPITACPSSRSRPYS